MKFIFNDSFSTDPNLFSSKTDERSVFVSGNLIFEKQKTAASGAVNDLIKKYKRADPSGKKSIAADVTGKTGDASGWSDSDVEDFFDGISSSSSSSSRSVDKGSSITRGFIDEAVESTDELGVAADALGAKLTLRSRLVDQLKPFMSSEEIGKLFDDFIFKIKIPESELLDFINYIIDFADEAGSNIKELFRFATMHFATRADKGLTLLLLELGTKLQKKYPEVNFFQMMIDSANGSKPKLGKLAIINEKEDMDIARKLFTLSQHRIVEQNEAANRERKQVRDALQSMQERTNLQRALFEALKMNEVERSLTTELEKFGETFRRLITNPQFRALKDLQYTILAGRRLLDAWMSLYIEKQPVTPSRSTDETRDDPRAVSRFTGQQQGRNKGDFPSRRQLVPGFPRASLDYENVRVAQSTQNTQQSTQNLQQALQIQKQLINKLVSSINSRVIPRIRNGNLPIETKNFLLKYVSTISETFSRAASSGEIISFHDKYKQAIAKLGVSATGSADFNRIANSTRFRKVYAQQAGAQTTRPAVQPGFEQASGFIDMITGGLYNLGTIETLTKMVGTGRIRDVISLYRFVATYETNLFMELDLQLGRIGRLLPSDQSIMPGGTLSPGGAQILANEQEVDAILKIFGEEQKVAERLSQKIKADEQVLSQAENNLGNEADQVVQLSEGKEDKAPMEFPAELKQKYEAFVVQVNDVIKNLYTLLGMRRNMKKRAEIENADPVIISTLNRIEQEILIRIKNHEQTRDKYKSTNLIRVELERVRRFKQLLKPVEKQIQLFADAGISIASLITQPNGLLNTLRRIRDEEENALDKLIDRYTELKETITPVNLGNFQKPKVTEETGAVEIGEPEEPTAEMI